MNTQVIKLELSLEAVQVVMNALGELPAKTNAFALAMEIKAQAEAQLPPPEENPAE
jgi:hypothetical protein